ncbi:MAG: stage V sporulation protein T [Clostridiales bacterium]|nr:stage V sporulation protein T [Clostridiales bacterium]
MKATGIVRRIDDLGRVVIPKEIRRTLRLREGTPLEIFTDKEGEIILKKYSPMIELGVFAKQYADALGQTLGHGVAVSDRDQIVAVSGSLRKELIGMSISKSLENLIISREYRAEADHNCIPLIQGEEMNYTAQAIYPIICEGDAVGSVIVFSKEQKIKFTDTEKKAAACAASFLGRQLES